MAPGRAVVRINLSPALCQQHRPTGRVGEEFSENYKALGVAECRSGRARVFLVPSNWGQICLRRFPLYFLRETKDHSKMLGTGRHLVQRHQLGHHIPYWGAWGGASGHSCFPPPANVHPGRRQATAHVVPAPAWASAPVQSGRIRKLPTAERAPVPDTLGWKCLTMVPFKTQASHSLSGSLGDPRSLERDGERTSRLGGLAPALTHGLPLRAGAGPAPGRRGRRGP